MIGYDVRVCHYCQCSIVGRQRWVREKIHDPSPTTREAAHRHFHAEVFGGEEVSCWEKYWTEREIARMAVIAQNIGKEKERRILCNLTRTTSALIAA